MASLLLLVLGAVAVQPVDVGDLSSTEVAAFEQELVASVEALVSVPVVTVDAKFRCSQPNCGGIGDASEIVRYTFEPGATRIAISLERVRDGVAIAKARDLGPFEPSSWRGRFDGLISKIFVEPLSASARPPTLLVDAPQIEPEAEVSWTIPVLVTSSGLLAASGIGFAISSANAQARLRSERLLVDDELEATESQASSHRIIATVLLSAAIVAAGATVYAVLNP